MFRHRIANLCIVILLVFLAACQQTQPQPAANATASETTPSKNAEDTAVISASGEVVPEKWIQLTFSGSGSLENLTIQEGDFVTAGQELAALGGDARQNSLVQATAALKQAEAALQAFQEKPAEYQITQARANLQKAKDDLATLLNPSELAVNQAKMAIVDAQKVLDDAQKAVTKLSRDRGSQEQIEAARAGYLLAQDKVDQMQSAYEDTPGEPDSDAGKALALSNLAAAKNERDRALANLNWYLGKPDEAEINKKNTELALAQSKFDDAQKQLDDLLKPSQTDIELAQARVSTAQGALDDLLKEPAAYQLESLQAQVAAAQQALELLQAQSKLVAPFGGKIIETYVKAGDNITPGSPAFLLADVASLQVETTDLSELDVARLQVGDTATISFDALPDVKVTGKIVRIADKAEPGSNVTFKVVLALDTIPDGLRWGMTAFVTFEK
jgi:multidrug efflux pump subunit AcrA (membrane-fusion protein)